MYYPCSENKDTDQLHCYRKPDLRLCFAYAKCCFLMMQLIYSHNVFHCSTKASGHLLLINR